MNQFPMGVASGLDTWIIMIVVYLFLTSIVPAKLAVKALEQELCQGDFLALILVTRGGGEKNSTEERNNDELSDDSRHFPPSLSLFPWFSW